MRRRFMIGFWFGGIWCRRVCLVIDQLCVSELVRLAAPRFNCPSCVLSGPCCIPGILVLDTLLSAS